MTSIPFRPSIVGNARASVTVPSTFGPLIPNLPGQFLGYPRPAMCPTNPAAEWGGTPSGLASDKALQEQATAYLHENLKWLLDPAYVGPVVMDLEWFRPNLNGLPPTRWSMNDFDLSQTWHAVRCGTIIQHCPGAMLYQYDAPHRMARCFYAFTQDPSKLAFDLAGRAASMRAGDFPIVWPYLPDLTPLTDAALSVMLTAAATAAACWDSPCVNAWVAADTDEQAKDAGAALQRIAEWQSVA